MDLKLQGIKIVSTGSTLVVQWFGFGTFTAAAPSSIPGWGTKILQTVWCSQKKKKEKKSSGQLIKPQRAEPYAPPVSNSAEL